MKDFLKKVENIKEKLTEGHYKELSDILLEVQLSSGTIGEVFAGVAFNLKKIKEENNNAYNLAKDDIDNIISYAKSINYL